MKQDDDGLNQLAGSILDGASVDWPSAEASADDSARRIVRELKVIAGVAGAQGDVPPSDPEQSPSPEATSTWSTFRLLGQVGEGAYGKVYRARDTRLDREVALKLLHAPDSDRAGVASIVVDEGRMLAQVRHPNVVTVYGADRIAGQVGLWMEFIHGRTLEQVLREGGPLGEQAATEIGLNLCRAVSAVHRTGLVHRDIKAQNVMHEDGGRIVLMDFGTGFQPTGDLDHLARDLAGTPLYLAPEILEGQDATVQSDMYSVGVLLYHLVTGSFPVQGQSVQEVRNAHAHGERASLHDERLDLSEHFIQVVDRALARRPEARYESAVAMERALAERSNVAAQSSSKEASATSSRRRALIAGAVLLLAAIGSLWVIIQPSNPGAIAVLPFKNLSTEPDSDYFVDGLTDAVISDLAGIDGLEVRSRTSSFFFKDKPRNLRDVGDQLEAALVVEGSVLRSGDRLRVTAQLVQVAGDVPLWSEQFDRKLEDVFEIQDEISRAIVNKLRLTLGRGQRRYDGDGETYALYLEGRTLVSRKGIPALQRAATLFEQVVTRDPSFAPAHAGLANAYALMSMPAGGLPFAKAHSIMRPAAIKARELDPLLAAAHAATGWVYLYEHDWTNAESAFNRAIELDPSLTESYTSYSISTLRPLGKHDEALRVLGAALRHDPLSLDVQREIGEVYVDAGRYDEAIEVFQRVRAVDADFPFVENFLAGALIYAGRVSDALPLLERLDGQNLGQFRGTARRRAPLLGVAYAKSGRRAEAEQVAAEHEDTPARVVPIYAALGNTDRAFEGLERMAVSDPHQVGRLLMRPEMEVLRSDSRLPPFRKRFGLP